MENQNQNYSERLIASLCAYKSALQDLSCVYAISVGGVENGQLTIAAKDAFKSVFGPMQDASKLMEKSVWAEIDRTKTSL
jgi:hypothetical protein